ncbi:MAG TPA: S8 family serine peptidase [Pirellulaceae bacterium]|nr:S8 family serine peptidase [Pirellulaceae bacterium]HMO93074.1 S8 family serine peptidase [Pirellulaceae bacterium]HMP69975.1 S8 family serine peptidase [Pirellulaceae bacterium]
MSKSSSPDSSPFYRKSRIEKFEDRIVFSADGLLLANIQLADQPDELLQPVEIRTFNHAIHAGTGLSYVANEYELDGRGQTVAVIDTGIAWDHDAFGGGFGAGQRVVGGWDFAENDNNPYDDGPAGYHGTHVAGIIGGRHELHAGVAPGVDLVALRVFNDQGVGQMDWVEQALRWIRDNKNAFRNPITTVNLSLGANWNANTVPNWATLENEFQLLRQSGIFISVAAGNAFQQYLSPGVAYPAASPHVVPVASHDADGNLSDFSQRNHRSLVAPGEMIRSAVPGHLFGTTATNRFLAASGTSMAAPYVAGASTLLRQAFEFMGVSGIDQALIYQHLRQTSDSVFDAITQSNYSRINLKRAIDTIIGDDFSRSRHDAFELGGIGGVARSQQGIIGGRSDIDWFKFTANSSGEAVINIQGQNISTNVFVANVPFTVDGDQIRFQVVAGQEYRFSVSSDDALGRYQFNAKINPSVIATNVGNVVARTIQAQIVNGSRWYEVNAGNNGLFTTQAIFASGSSTAQIEVYDANMQLLGTGTTNHLQSRFDLNVSQGQKLFVRLTGEGAEVDLKFTNLICVQNQQLIAKGTAGNDVFSVDMRSNLRLTINGTSYQFNPQALNQVKIEGLTGADKLNVFTGSGDRTTLSNGRAYVQSSNLTVTAEHFFRIDVVANGINDHVIFVDSNGNETFRYSPDQSTMRSGNYILTASGQQKTHALFSSGTDIVSVYGTQANERFVANSDRAWFFTPTGQGEKVLCVRNWSQMSVEAGGGTNSAHVNDTPFQDQFVLNSNQASRTSSLNKIVVKGFQRVNVAAGQVGDKVLIEGSAGDDRLVVEQQRIVMHNNSASLIARNFAQATIDVSASGGNDRAVLYDTVGNDVVHSNHHVTRMESTSRVIIARGFRSVDVFSIHGGNDIAHLTGHATTQQLYYTGNAATIVGEHYQVRVNHFKTVNVTNVNSNALAFLTGTSGDDVIGYAADRLTLSNSNSKIQLDGFRRINVDAGSGLDVVEIAGFETGDRIQAQGNQLLAYLSETELRLRNFTWMDAYAAAGATVEQDIRSVDFWFQLHGNWQQTN